MPAKNDVGRSAGCRIGRNRALSGGQCFPEGPGGFERAAARLERQCRANLPLWTSVPASRRPLSAGCPAFCCRASCGHPAGSRPQVPGPASAAVLAASARALARSASRIGAGGCGGCSMGGCNNIGCFAGGAAFGGRSARFVALADVELVGWRQWRWRRGWGRLAKGCGGEVGLDRCWIQALQPVVGQLRHGGQQVGIDLHIHLGIHRIECLIAPVPRARRCGRAPLRRAPCPALRAGLP